MSATPKPSQRRRQVRADLHVDRIIALSGRALCFVEAGRESNQQAVLKGRRASPCAIARYALCRQAKRREVRRESLDISQMNWLLIREVAFADRMVTLATSAQASA